MTAGTVAPGLRGDTASFDLQRFEWTAPDRLEVAGHWYGVRGIRFMRPTLDLRTDDGERHRLLALLDHKPWAAEDGHEWVAAFPWKGDLAELSRVELAAGPSVAVELPLPGGRATKRGGKTRSAARAPAKRPTTPAPTESPKLRLERDAAVAARDEARRERDAALAARDDALGERDEALRQAAEVAQARAARSELETVRFERDGALAARDEARSQLEALTAERDAAVTARDAALSQLESVMSERDKAIAGRGASLRARELAMEERDAARGSVDAALRQHEAASVERDALRRERDKLRARLDERRQAVPAAEPEAATEPIPTQTVPLPSEPASASPWRARLLALGALAIMLVVAAVAVLHGLI